jgi:hypothetical protein
MRHQMPPNPEPQPPEPEPEPTPISRPVSPAAEAPEKPVSLWRAPAFQTTTSVRSRCP